jgi:hypothetical protein
MDAIPFKEQDLYSFGGLAIVVPLLVGGLKTFLAKWVTGKEPAVALILTYIIGLAAKFSAPKTAFPGSSWLGLIVGLFFVALAAQLVHDKFVNPVLKGQDVSSGAKPSTTPGLPPADPPK